MIAFAGTLLRGEGENNCKLRTTNGEIIGCACCCGWYNFACEEIMNNRAKYYLAGFVIAVCADTDRDDRTRQDVWGRWDESVLRVEACRACVLYERGFLW